MTKRQTTTPVNATGPATPTSRVTRQESLRAGTIVASLRAWLAGALLVSMASATMAQSNPAVKVWKDPNCGCCGDWVAHLEKEGFAVEVINQGNASARASLGMPEKYGSCHTASVGGYALEGHVPAAQIKRLLRETPKARGLAVPGMPVGSPGMDDPVYGGRKDAYDVLLIQADGNSTVYQSYR